MYILAHFPVPALMSFESLGLIDPLLRALSERGYTTPTPVQQKVIPAALRGRDAMVVAQTGTGKTAAFALPAIQRLSLARPRLVSHCMRVLVLVPTRELAEQVQRSFRSYSRHVALRSAAVYGGVSIRPQITQLSGGLDVLVATPGRLVDLCRSNAAKLSRVQTLILDEADRMLDLGFAPDIERVLDALPQRRQTLLFSATLPSAIQALAAKLLVKPLIVDLGQQDAVAGNIAQSVIVADKKRKAELLVHLIEERGRPQVLVFVKTRAGAEQLATQLRAQGLAAEAIHGDKPQRERMQALTRFKRGDASVLVATDVAGRGLDIAAMPLVVNLDLPLVAQDYIHRVGRTGRAGASGQAISLVSADEVKQLAAIEAQIGHTLPRHTVRGFEPQHRVPPTANEKNQKAVRTQKAKKKLKKRKQGASQRRSSQHAKSGRRTSSPKS